MRGSVSELRMGLQMPWVVESETKVRKIAAQPFVCRSASLRRERSVNGAQVGARASTMQTKLWMGTILDSSIRFTAGDPTTDRS